jgi:multicomponent Na+:H+ antiporter subunit D
MKDHLPVLLLTIPLAGSWLVLAAGFLSHRLSRTVAYAILLFDLLLIPRSLPHLLSQESWHYSLGGWAPPWGIELILTPFSLLLAAIVLLTALFSVFYLGSFSLLAGLLKIRESLAGFLLLVLASSLIGLLWIRDGFTLYLFLQIFLVGATALMVCLARQGWLAFFYFLLTNSAGASLLLMGFLFLYAVTGTFHLDDILAQLFISKNYPMALVAGVLTAAGWVCPFFFPSPRFFTGLLSQTPPFLVGFISSVFVRIGVYALFLFIFFVLGVPGIVQPLGLVLLEYLLVLLFLLEFFSAAREKDFLHSVAFLSVAQLGYVLSGFILGNKSALTGALMELLTQALIVAGLFFIAGSLRSGSGGIPFSRMVGLARHRPLTGLSLVVFAAAIVGIPPTGGFFGKWYLIQGALEKRDGVILGAVILSVAFNFVYFFKLTLFLYEHRSASLSRVRVSLATKVPFLLLAAGVLLLGILHQEIIHSFIEPALPKAFQNLPVPNVPFLGKQVE